MDGWMDGNIYSSADGSGIYVEGLHFILLSIIDGIILNNVTGKLQFMSS